MRPTDIEQAELLEKAADLYESGQLGWMQESEFELGGEPDVHFLLRACAMGALRVADATENLGNPYWNVNAKPTYTANLLITRTLPIRLGVPLHSWNDTAGRTKEEVIDFFKEAAKDLRNGAEAV